MRNSPHNQASTDQPLRLLIVDDSALFRQVLQRCVQALPGCRLVSCAANYREALATLATQRVELAVVDLHMRDLNGLQTMALVHEAYPATRVLIVSADDSEAVAATCLAQGADGFVSKRWLFHDLRRAIAELFPNSALAKARRMEEDIQSVRKPAGQRPGHQRFSQARPRPGFRATNPPPGGGP